MSYATLNTQFGLPAPPPRSVFSTVRNASGRAWFPDFTKDQNPVASLENFIQILFRPVLHKSTFIQLKILTVLIAIIGISIFLIILRRLYEKSFWLFRMVTRSNGRLIVPNAITAFVTIESTFAILLIALCWEVIAWFQYGRSPKYVVLWIGLTWLPLILGAWCTTVGIIYARPDALGFVSPQPGKPHSLPLRIGITPAVVNAFVFAIPVVQIASVVVPVVLAQRCFSQAYDHWRSWSASITPDATLSKELLIETQQIWFKVLDAAYYLSVCMAVWETWVCLLLICYCMAGSSLIAMLRKQLETLKSFKQNRTFSTSFPSPNPNEVHLRRPSDAFPATPVLGQIAEADADVEKQAAMTSSPGLLGVQGPPRSLSVSSGVSDSATLVSGDGDLKRSASQKGSMNNYLKPGTRRNGSISEEDKDANAGSTYFTREELENEDQPSHSFFPAVRPSAFERPAQTQATAGRQQTQKRYLEKFYINFLVQFVGLLLCILFFAIYCGKLVTTWYSAWEANEFGTAIETALLVVVWVTVVLASVIIFAILSRTYEPVLSSVGRATASRSSGGSRQGSLALANLKSSGGRLSGAKTWAASTLSQLSSGEHRQGQEIGLDHVRSSSAMRANESLQVGRTSMHAYEELKDEHYSPRVQQDPPSPKSMPTSLRKMTSSSTPDMHIPSQTARSPGAPRRQRSFRSSSVSSSGIKGSKGVIMVEQTVSIIIEDPATEGIPVIDDDSSTGSGFSHGGVFAESAARPATVWLPAASSSVRTQARGDGESGWANQREEVMAASEDSILHRSRSDLSMQTRGTGRIRPSTAGDESVGLGIGMVQQAWTAPSAWGSGKPDPELMQEDAKMRLRMASRPGAGTTKRA